MHEVSTFELYCEISNRLDYIGSLFDIMGVSVEGQPLDGTIVALCINGEKSTDECMQLIDAWSRTEHIKTHSDQYELIKETGGKKLYRQGR